MPMSLLDGKDQFIPEYCVTMRHTTRLGVCVLYLCRSLEEAIEAVRITCENRGLEISHK